MFKSQTIIEALKIAFYALFAYLEIPIESFLILVVFICLDTFFGALASFRLGNKFDFKVLYWGFFLKIAMLIIPLIVALLAKGLHMNFSIIVVLTIKILTVSEFYSCLGNLYIAKNKKEINRIDVVSLILISLRKMTKNFIEKSLIKIDGNIEGKN